MKSFFLSKKFILPWILIMLLACVFEVVVRSGYWDPMVSHQTYLGKSIHRIRAVDAFGFDKVDAITIGDSRLDWGLDHKKLMDHRSQQGINHLRMTFEQMEFMALKAGVFWAIDHFPNLKEINIGINANKVSVVGAPFKQTMVAWPFIDYFEYTDYEYRNRSDAKHLFMALHHWHGYWYLPDIQDYVFSSSQRNKRKHSHERKGFLHNLTNNRNFPRNTCPYDLSSLEACHQTAQQLNTSGQTLTSLERVIVRECTGKRHKHNQARVSKSVTAVAKKQGVDQWLAFLKRVTDQQIKVNLMVIPETPFYRYAINSTHSQSTLVDILAGAEQMPNVSILDFGALFETATEPACQYYSDTTHYNNQGRALLTDSLIKALDDEANPIVTPVRE